MKILKTIDRKDYKPGGKINKRLASRAVIFKDHQIAMVKCDKYGYYKFPGGGVKEHESLIDALKRETLEETGLVLLDESIKLTCYVKEIHNDYFCDNTIFEQESYYFTANTTGQIFPILLDDYEAELGYHLEFTTIDNALKVNQKIIKKGECLFLKRENNILRYLKECRATLELVEPSELYLGQIKSYRKMFIERNDSMDGTASLKNYENINEWLTWCHMLKNKETCPKYLVPSNLYLLLKNHKKVVGMVDIRHYLNENLFNCGGNIGYSIKPNERGKGYATRMLRLALEKCKELKKNNVLKNDPVLITCNDNNIASKKVILANGGKYENTVPDQKDMIERYWIKIGDSNE